MPRAKFNSAECGGQRDNEDMAEQHIAAIEHPEGTYTAVFERAGEGTWSGRVPDLPGVLGMGDTLDEAKVSVQEAIGYWIEDMKRRGQPVPPPSDVTSPSLAFRKKRIDENF